MCIFAYDIVIQCYNCLFTHVWVPYYQTRTQPGPGYSSVLGIGLSNFAMDWNYCLSPIQWCQGNEGKL